MPLFLSETKLESIAQAVAAHNANVVLLDYVQRLRVTGQRLEKRAELDSIMETLRTWCFEGVAVLAISSLNRPAKRGEGYNVTDITAFKESGELEYGCDEAVILSRPSLSQDGLLDLITVKSRYGTLSNSIKLIQREHLAFEQYQPIAFQTDASILAKFDDLPPWYDRVDAPTPQEGKEVGK
jgi:hypothetical protein